MKTTFSALALILMLLCSTLAHAAFVSGSTGALGAFNPTANTLVTLPPDGVLNYTTINIPTGVTVTFQKNAANTPVYMLATGDVIITGTVSVNGIDASSTDTGKGGPGGYDGGCGGAQPLAGGKGSGPGGGNPGVPGGYPGGGGGFGASGANGQYSGGAGGQPYGNARVSPLIGGSGGGGGAWDPSGYLGGYGGGGGGGIVIASSTAITVSGSVTANGGNGSGPYYSNGGGGGSGGGIRLIANAISGNGSISASPGSPGSRGGQGSVGRIRLETAINNRTAPTNPPYSFGNPGSVFLANTPSLNIVSLTANGTSYNVPASPTGSYSQPDMLLPNTTSNPVAVNVSATNIPDGTTVSVWVIPQYGNATSFNSILSGSVASANVNLSTTYSNVVTAQATFTVTGMYYNGEEIEKVRVATKLGGNSETTYITKSGKEIKGELFASLK